jgi:hypothetical protein
MPHRRAPAYVHGGVGILVEPALSESRMREIRVPRNAVLNP